jgi:hypothetical protein
MTLLGKIFTVLILIMSLVFMSFSVMVLATNQNWKMKVVNPRQGEKGHDPDQKLGLKYQIEEREQIIAGLREEKQSTLNSMSREKVARALALAQLQTKYERVKREYDRVNVEKTKLENDLTVVAGELQAAGERLEQLTGENLTLRDKINTVIADNIVQHGRVVALSDQIHELEGIERNLTERQTQLADDVTKGERVLRDAGLTKNSPTEGTPPPLSGYVSAVSTQNKDFLEITLGEDDGIRLGHELDVFRNRSYLGRVVIRKVSTNRSVAQVKSQKNPIKKYDSVTTKLDS